MNLDVYSITESETYATSGDETRPLCRNCAKRFINIETCEVSAEFNGGTLRLKEDTIFVNSSLRNKCISNHPPGIALSEKFRTQELRLFYHYVTSTCKSMPYLENDQSNGTWILSVPQMSFESDYVYSAILATAAIHLWTLSPTDMSRLSTAHRYLNWTLSRYRIALSSVDEFNSAQLLTSSILITFHTRLRAKYAKLSGSPYTIPTECFDMQEGAKALHRVSSTYLRNSKLMAYFDPSGGPPTRPGEVSSYLHPVAADLLHGFAKMNISPENMMLYETLLVRWSRFYVRVLEGMPRWWVHRSLYIGFLPTEYMTLLRMHDPGAMAIMAYFHAVFYFLADAWWLEDMGEYEIRGLATIMPTEWMWSLEWPFRVISPQGTIER